MRSGRMFQLSRVLLLSWLSLWLTPSLLADTTETAAAKAAYTNEELLTKMLIVSASEQVLNGIPALGVTFSQSLDSKADLNAFFTVTHNGKALEGGWILADNPRRLYFPRIEPNATYRVQVRPGIESQTGLRLQEPGDFKIKTRNIKPAFDFASRGSILPGKLSNGLPVRVVNVPELDVEFLRVKPDKLRDVLQSMRLDSTIRNWELNDVHELTDSVYTGRYVTDAEKNARKTLLLPVESIDALQQPGLYFAVMREPGRFSDNAYRITHFIVTNIGMHVRLYQKKIEVLTHALDSGKGLAEVQLKLQGSQEVLQAESDQQGRAKFEYRPKGSLLLTAELDGQFAFLDLREAALDLSEYPVAGLPDKALAPFIYSGRDLYRPGETVDLAIILRNRDGLSEGIKNLNLRLIRPDAKLLRETSLTASNAELGYFHEQFKLPEDAATGLWRAEVRMGAKDSSPLKSFNFHVEEFMPERMTLSLSAQQDLVVKDEKLAVSVRGDYLYGAPAAGNELKAVRVMTLNRHPLKAYKEYYFGTLADKPLLKRKEYKPLKLDEKGAAILDAEALPTGIRSPLVLRVIASLSEAGGRVVTRTLKKDYWPAQALVGIAPVFREGVVERNSQASFEIIRANPAGDLVAGQNLAATLIKEDYEYFWEHNEQEGWVRKETRNEYPLVQEPLTIAAGEKARLSFPVAYGGYRLEVEDSETGLKSVYRFRAGWTGDSAKASRPDKIELELDKAAYKAGDTVQLKITPLAAGEAVVAVEADSMLWSQSVSLPAEGTTVSIPVQENWARHDLYISVTSFRPASRQAQIAPNRALGIIHLPLDRSARKMELAIDAPEEVLPEQTVKIGVQAANLKGGKALLSLAAVDVGVLNITNYATPDPWSFYFGKHKYGVDLYDDYGKIIETIAGAKLRQRFGGGNTASAGGARARANVQVVALFEEMVEFDEQGKAEVALKLPGFDGRLKLMAVALGEQLIGSADKEMQVASPVVASLSGPRFLASTDSSFVVLELNNVSEREQTVSLGVSANTPLKFLPVEREIKLSKGQRELLKLPFAANQGFGVGQVRLKLTGNDGGKDFVANRSINIALRPPYPGQRSSHRAELPAKGTLTLPKDQVDGLLADTLQARLTVSNTPALPVAGALRDLLRYPYGCLEQTASSAYPYLFLEADETEKWGLSPLTMKQRNERVQTALLRLMGMQLSSGGFTLWGNYGVMEHWLTPYVADFMLDAKRQGFTVPSHLLKRTLDKLDAGLKEGYRRPLSRYGFSDHPMHMDFAARAYAAYVMARENRASLGTLRAMLKDESAKVVSGLPLVHLGLALILQGDKPKGQEAIQRGLTMPRNPEHYLGDYGSPVRDRAMMLYQLLVNDQEVPQLGEQLAVLGQLIRERDYFSTQEQVFIFLLGREIEKRAAEDWQAVLMIGDRSVNLSGPGSYVQRLSPDDVDSPINISSAHDKPLYLSLDVQGYPKQAPAERSEPVKIERDWFNLAGKPMEAAAIKTGDLLLTRLNIKSQVTMNDALVVDLLPSGFEIENTNLMDNKALQDVTLEGMERSVMDLIASTQTRTEEFRDDRYIAALKLNADARHHLFYLVRVIARGESVVPPAYLEDMYQPDVFAVGASAGKLLLE